MSERHTFLPSSFDPNLCEICDRRKADCQGSKTAAPTNTNSKAGGAFDDADNDSVGDDDEEIYRDDDLDLQAVKGGQKNNGDETTTSKKAANGPTQIYQTGKKKEGGFSSVDIGGGIVKQLLMGKSHTILLTTSGSVYSWGSNQFGQLGRSLRGKKIDLTPAVIPGLENRMVVMIAVGANHNFVLTADGAVYGWGANKNGQLGNNKKEDSENPFRIAELDSCTYICAGENSSAAITRGGTVYTWGENSKGQLGHMTKGQDVVLPRPLETYPWNRDTDISVAHGPDSLTFNTGNNQMIKDAGASKLASVSGTGSGGNGGAGSDELNREVQRLRNRIRVLEGEVDKWRKDCKSMEEQLYKDNDDSMKAAIGDDSIVKELQRMQTALDREIFAKQSSLRDNQEALRWIDHELDECDHQLRECEENETKLWDQIDDYENHIRLAQMDGERVDDAKVLMLERLKNDKKELARANDSIKSLYFQKKNQKEETKNQLLDEQRLLEKELGDVEHRMGLFKTLNRERRKAISQDYFKQNVSDFENAVNAIHETWETLADSTIEALSHQSDRPITGLKELITMSNDCINNIIQQANSLDVADDSPAKLMRSKLLDLVRDNAHLRKKLNFYIEGLLMQTSNKLEEFYHGFDVGKQNRSQAGGRVQTNVAAIKAATTVATPAPSDTQTPRTDRDARSTVSSAAGKRQKGFLSTNTSVVSGGNDKLKDSAVGNGVKKISRKKKLAK
eukprot:GILJ01007823.1.p1 GENE.GILJ01007823.1~~GILJ01007823.1.p1  ORF type:complete len:733 (-),score=141.86 GILJ01007823.1:14-2212(-)